MKAYLDNIGNARILLSSVGSPQKKLKFIHVCGSNGKGSVCAILASVLEAGGYRVGLFTSPHLQDLCERIRVNGSMIPQQDYDALYIRLSSVAETMPAKPGYFCFLTALAITYFSEQHCDIVILETGIGGTYDATNVIDAPEIAVVTNIGLEHTELLGNTIEEITRDKAGIIKKGCHCALYDGAPAATKIIREVCKKLDVPLRIADFSTVQACTEMESGFPKEQIIRVGDSKYRLGLLGSYQIKNTALALTALEALRERGWSITEAAIRTGLASVRWPARVEVLSREPLVILDGGHNPQCAEALVETLDSLLPGQKTIFLVGMMKDKNYQDTMRILTPKAHHFLCVTPPDERGLAAQDLAAFLRSENISATAFTTVSEGLHHALEAAGGTPVVIFGSLYLAGEIRDLMEREP